MTTATPSITSKQKNHLGRLLEVAISNLPKDVAQRVIMRGGEFQKRVREVIADLGEFPYIKEEVASNYGYPQGFRYRTPLEQTRKLLGLKPFKKLDAGHVEELSNGKLPQGYGWAVVPKPGDYCQAIQSALGLLFTSRKIRDKKLHNRWSERRALGDIHYHLRPEEKTAQAHVKLNEQPGDFWVFPFQFGLLHRGRCGSDAKKCFTEREFGLGVYETAILLLTHPDRITGPDQLYLDCTGTQYIPVDPESFFDGIFRRWGFSYYKIFGVYEGSDDRPSLEWGAVSGFVPFTFA